MQTSQVQVAARGITARKVVAQLLAALRRCGSVLAGVLPPAGHVAVASALLQTTLASIIGALLRVCEWSPPQLSETA